MRFWDDYGDFIEMTAQDGSNSVFYINKDRNDKIVFEGGGDLVFAKRLSKLEAIEALKEAISFIESD